MDKKEQNMVCKKNELLLRKTVPEREEMPENIQLTKYSQKNRKIWYN